MVSISHILQILISEEHLFFGYDIFDAAESKV